MRVCKKCDETIELFTAALVSLSFHTKDNRDQLDATLILKMQALLRDYEERNKDRILACHNDYIRQPSNLN